MPSDTAELVKRLRAACNGHPYAEIPWPHRILHEAADYIERTVAQPGPTLEQITEVIRRSAPSKGIRDMLIERLTPLYAHAPQPVAPPIKMQGFEAAWEAYHSFLVEKIRGCEDCQLWGDAYNKFMELCPVNKAIEEPIPPSDTSAERVAETAEVEHDEEFMASFRRGVADLDAGRVISADDLERELDVAPPAAADVTPKFDGDPIAAQLWERIAVERRKVVELELKANRYADHNAFLEQVIYEKRQAADALHAIVKRLEGELDRMKCSHADLSATKGEQP